MADIDVVPKRGTNVWLWVIAAIVVALIIAALMGAFTTTDMTAEPVGGLLESMGAPYGVV